MLTTYQINKRNKSILSTAVARTQTVAVALRVLNFWENRIGMTALNIFVLLFYIHNWEDLFIIKESEKQIFLQKLKLTLSLILWSKQCLQLLVLFWKPVLQTPIEFQSNQKMQFVYSVAREMSLKRYYLATNKPTAELEHNLGE